MRGIPATLLALSLFFVLPAIGADHTLEDHTLDIFGNANMDDSIDELDLSYIREVIDGTKERTDLADANLDGRIDEADIERIEEIIRGEQPEIAVIDAVGRTVAVKTPVERILPLHMRHAVAICVLGGKEKTVGVSTTVADRKALFSELSNLPCVGRVRAPDLEQIIVLEPDLIVTFTNAPLSAELEEKLPEDMVVVRFDLSRSEDLKEEMTKLGYLIGERDATEAYADWYDLYMDTVKARVFEIPEEDLPLVFMERARSGEERAVRSAYATDMGYTDLCDVAGGVNVAQGYIDYSADVESEWVIAKNPDVIIGLSYGAGYKDDDVTPLKEYHDEIVAVPGFDCIDAVKNDRVYVISGDFAVGPQLVIGTVTVAKWLYPDLFEDMNVDAIHEEFLRELMDSDYDLEEHGVFVYPPMD